MEPFYLYSRPQDPSPYQPDSASSDASIHLSKRGLILAERSGLSPQGPIVIAELFASRIVHEIFDSKATVSKDQLHLSMDKELTLASSLPNLYRPTLAAHCFSLRVWLMWKPPSCPSIEVRLWL